jgi:TM2 domain-containing membrane protein YozV
MGLRRPPAPRTAFWLSLAVPGLGLLYAGAPLRALAIVALALLGFFGALDSFDFMDRRPEYAWYGAVAVGVFVAAWWGGAVHARAVAERFQAWPALYRRELWRTLKPARVELGMVFAFAALLALYAHYPKPPRWVPDMPRYWFLYEAFGALYLVVATQARVAGFFAITLAGTLALLFFTRIPPDTLVLAYLLALPACWEALRSEQARRIHGMRFASCLVAAYLALFAYGIVLAIAEAVTGLRQYQLRLASDFNVSIAAFGILYYAIRAAFEVLIGAFAKPGEAPD